MHMWQPFVCLEVGVGWGEHVCVCVHASMYEFACELIVRTGEWSRLQLEIPETLGIWIAVLESDGRLCRPSEQTRL